jgi:hypothetical protein
VCVCVCVCVLGNIIFCKSIFHILNGMLALSDQIKRKKQKEKEKRTCLFRSS